MALGNTGLSMCFAVISHYMFYGDHVEIMALLSLAFSQTISNMTVMLLLIQFCKTVQRIAFLYHHLSIFLSLENMNLEIIFNNNNNNNNNLLYQPYPSCFC